MADFTREALEKAITDAQNDTWKVPPHLRVPYAKLALDAILANARIVPPTATDDMARAFEKCFSDSESWKLEINAAIDAGKLK